MTAVLVEDMPAALRALGRDLQDYCPDVEIIGTAGSVVEAAKLLRKEQPDLLFLDVTLGDGTSFDLLEIFPDLQSQIIFITASDEHAVRAFRFAAVDYLLKPAEPEMLKAAVERASAKTGGPAQLELLKHSLQKNQDLPDRISLHTAENIVIVKIANIIRCEADSNNTRFIIADERPVFVTKTLKYFDGLLAGHGFVRVHQSHLVNFEHVVEFKKLDGGYLRLSNGEEVPVASRKRAEVMALLG